MQNHIRIIIESCRIMKSLLLVMGATFLCLNINLLSMDDGIPMKLNRDCYVACVFCRRPVKKEHEFQKTYNCNICSDAVIALLVNKLNSNRPLGQAELLRHAAYVALSISEDVVARSYIESFFKVAVRSRVFKNEGVYLYKGYMLTQENKKKHIWVNNFDFDSAVDRRYVTAQESIAHVTSICEKYNIWGPEMGTSEALLKGVPQYVVATYQE